MTDSSFWVANFSVADRFAEMSQTLRPVNKFESVMKRVRSIDTHTQCNRTVIVQPNKTINIKNGCGVYML